jgi:two-component system C4-dicarboxylate transport response regulator DctD
MTHGAKTVLALFVEANGIVRLRLTGALEQQGFVVSWAGNIDEAVRISEAHAVDLLLVDFNPPPKPGGEFFRRLKAVNPAIPMVLITEHKPDFDLSAVGWIGAVLEKPFRVADLIRAMHGLLNQARLLPRQRAANCTSKSDSPRRARAFAALNR